MTRRRLAVLSTQNAYRVPWHFDRGDGVYSLRNLGVERLTAVTFSLYGSGVMPASVPATLEPGDTLELVIAGNDLARDTIGVVRWFRPDGDEYLWRVSF
jgi:hypothetical protein